MTRFAIDKQLHIKAPRDGVAVYAGGQAYAAATGARLVEAVRLEEWNTLGIGMCTYSPEIYRRISEDNGRTWRVQAPKYTEDLASMAGEHMYPPMHWLDPSNGLLLSFHITFDFDPDVIHAESFRDAGTYSRTFRIFYATSRDGGRSWAAPRQVIARGEQYDAVHWGPGLHYRQNGGMPGVGPCVKLEDGTVLLPIVVNLWDGKRYQSGLLRGRWESDCSGLEWEFSDYISLGLDKSTQGVCEPAIALLDDGRLFMTLRSCGDIENKTFPSLKFWVASRDGGKTFTEPRPLTYEDGSPVSSPSSYAAILRSSRNGRHYWIANILDEPTFSAAPRYPLCIAELLPGQGALVRDSVTVIDTQPEDWPAAERDRRYTNFGFYEDRETGEFLLTLPEQPRTSWADFTADCYRYRIALA